MSTPEPHSTSAASSMETSPGWKTGLLVLAGAILAGLAAWGAGEFNRGRFDPTLTLELSLSNQMYGLANKAAARNASLVYGTLAGVTGLLLGLVGGLATGHPRRGILGGILGGVLGAAAAVGASFAVVPYFKARYNPDTEDLLLPMAVHGAIWAAAGLAGGLALGVALGGRARIVRSLIAGIVGALMGTAAYEVLGALFFASEKTVEPIAQGVGSRGLGHLAVAIGVGLLLAASLRVRRGKPTA